MVGDLGFLRGVVLKTIDLQRLRCREVEYRLSCIGSIGDRLYRPNGVAALVVAIVQVVVYMAAVQVEAKEPVQMEHHERLHDDHILWQALRSIIRRLRELWARQTFSILMLLEVVMRARDARRLICSRRPSWWAWLTARPIIIAYVAFWTSEALNTASQLRSFNQGTLYQYLSLGREVWLLRLEV